VPSDKRARQRAAREERLAAEARRAKRRKQIRNLILVVVVAGAIVGIAFAVSSGNNGSKTSASTTTTTKPSPAQAGANAVAVKAGCPANPHTSVNTQHYAAAPPMTIDTTKTYTATVTTTVGTITIALDAQAAPKTVNSFVLLADKGYFNCNIFHRVIPGFVDQTGDPTGTGTGTPGYSIPMENVPKAYATGDVAMGTSQATGVGSQWFIVAPGGASQLDADLASGGYPLFGNVTSGQSVVNAINAQGTPSGTPAVIQRILKITIATS